MKKTFCKLFFCLGAILLLAFAVCGAEISYEQKEIVNSFADKGNLTVTTTTSNAYITDFSAYALSQEKQIVASVTVPTERTDLSISYTYEGLQEPIVLTEEQIEALPTENDEQLLNLLLENIDFESPISYVLTISLTVDASEKTAVYTIGAPTITWKYKLNNDKALFVAKEESEKIVFTSSAVTTSSGTVRVNFTVPASFDRTKIVATYNEKGQEPSTIPSSQIYQQSSSATEKKLYLNMTGINVSAPTDYELTISYTVTETVDEVPTEVTYASSYDFALLYYAKISGITLTTQTKYFEIPSKVTYNEIEYTVTTLGQSAFNGNKSVFGALTIPSSVTTIESSVFSGTNVYGAVVLPDSVQSIGQSVFSGCKGLLSCTFPKDITTVPQNTFRECSSLTTFSTNGIITKYDGSCFYRCYALRNIVFDENLAEIASGAFQECSSLSGTIDLSHATSIGGNAFSSSIRIEKIILGKSNFTVSAFYMIRDLKEIVVDSDNPYYTVKDGVLFNKAKTTLYLYPASKSGTVYTVPSTVTKIDSYAFGYAQKLEKVNCNQESTLLVTISNNAFDRSSLKYFYAPSHITSISSSAFNNTSLTWKVIDNGDNTMNINGSTVTPKSEQYICAHYYGFSDTETTCEGQGTFVCVACGNTYTEEPLGHTGRVLETSEYSCTTDEYTVVDCVRCNQQVKIVTKASSGHQTKLTSSVEPTPYVSGYKVYTCKNCNATFYEDFSVEAFLVGDLNKDGKIDESDTVLLAQYLSGKSIAVSVHVADINGDDAVDYFDLILLKKFVKNFAVDLNETSYACEKHLHISSVVLYEATCFNKGLMIHYCLDCGKLVSSDESPSKEHTFVTDIQIEASCQKAGKIEGHCSVCDTKLSKTIEKLPHTGTFWTLDTKGYEYRRCSVCNTFESNKVDYSVLDEIVKQISPYYETYYSTESASLVRPILENASQPLTQVQVDDLIRQVENVLPRITYNVSTTNTMFIETTDYSKLNKTNYVWANIALVYFDENGNAVSINDYDAQIRTRGNSTNVSTKYPFNIKFHNDIEYLSLGAGKKFCLLANLFDKSMLRNALSVEFANLLGLDYTPQYEFIDLYLNGTYYGTYMMTTPLDIDENRIDIDDEIDTLLGVELRANANIRTPIYNMGFMIEDPKGEVNLSAEGLSKLYEVLYQADYAIKSGNWDEIQKYIDIDSMASFFIFHDIVKDKDIFYDSTRFYIKDGKIYGGPIWDLDLSMGNVNTTDNGSSGDFYSGSVYWNRNGKGNGTPFDESSKEDANNTSSLYASATGSWADGTWKDNYTLWFEPLMENSPEFRNYVYEKFMSLQEQITLFYADKVDETTGKTTEKSIITRLTTDVGIRTSFDHNYEKYSISSAYSSLAYNYENHQLMSFQDHIDYLREWLKVRNEWLIEYYAENYKMG